ncbi:MAG: hypothetical protein ACHQK9_07270 [Reyranellales bacterium]
MCILAIFFTQHTLAQTTQPSQESLIRAVAQLGDPDFQRREEAMRTLSLAGPAAEEILEEAAKLDNAEISARARALIQDFRWGIRADLPDAVVRLMRDYRKGNWNEKQAAIEALTKIDAPQTMLGIARLAGAEPVADRLRRHSLFGEPAGLAASYACQLAAINAPDEQIEQTLQLTLEAPNPEDACNAYPAWAAISGKTGHVAGLLERLGKDPRWPGNAVRALVLVKRASGDSQGALRLADELVDSDRGDCLLVEQGQWRRLAEEYSANRVQLGIPSLVAFAAAVNIRAGLPDVADTLARGLIEGTHQEPRSPAAGVQAALATEHLKDALALLDNLEDSSIRFQVLYLRQDYGAAMESARRLLTERSHSAEARSSIQLMLARMAFFTGDDKKGRELFSPLQADALNRRDTRLLYRLVATLALVDRREDALGLARDALARISTAEFRSAMIDALFGDRADDARVLLPLSTDSTEIRQQFAAVEKLLQDGPAPQQLDRLAARAATADIPVRCAIARLLEVSGRVEDATRILLDAQRAPGEKGTRTAALGDALVRIGQWPAAAAAYEQAFAARPMAAVAVFAGVCEQKAGQGDRARDWLDRGSRMLLGDGEKRVELARSLLRAGFDREAEEQLRLADRTSDFATGVPMAAARELALAEYRRGNYTAAAQQIERSVLLRLRLDQLTDESLAINDLHMLHRFQALSLLKEGKGPQAMHHIELCLALVPADVNLPIDAVPLLRKAGLEQQAADLLKRAVAAQEEKCRQYPESASMHNALAWLLVRLRTNLDAALEHAVKAHELSPSSLAIADTLAEVYFQRGDKQKAIDLIDVCARRQPDTVRHWQVRRRFETGTPDSDPPAEE